MWAFSTGCRDVTSTTCCFSRSFGPISRRTGTPRISHSENFQPGVYSSRASSITRMPAAVSSALSASARGSTVSCQLPRGIGTITTWCGATRGGSTRPPSSPCVMIDAADQPRGHAPRRRPRMLQLLVAALKLDAECLGEVLSEIVGRPGLQRAAVAHQRFDRVRARRAGELLARGLRDRRGRASRAPSRSTPCRHQAS